MGRATRTPLAGRYRDEAGRRRVAGSSLSKREAKKMALDKESEVRRGVWRDPKGGRTTFSTYVETQWLPTRVAEVNTLATYLSIYRSCLKPVFGEMPLGRISSPTIQQWVVRMQKDGVKPSTIRAKYKALATILGGRTGVSAVRDGLIERSPCEGIDLPSVDQREVDLYSVAEVDRLIAEIPAHWRPIPVLAADTGMRWGELMGTQVGDFRAGYSMLTIRRTIIEVSRRETGATTPYQVKGRPKGGRFRVVMLGSEAAAMVARLIEDRQLRVDDRLLSMLDMQEMPLRTLDWPNGVPVGRSYFRQHVWLPAHDRARIRPRRFHDLRGCHISWMLAGGADVATVMKLAGHRNVSTTQVYISAMDDAAIRGRRALEATRDRSRNLQ